VEAIYFSETTIDFHRTARRYDPEDRPLIATLVPVQHLILLKPVRFRKLVLFPSSAAELTKEKTVLCPTVKLPSHHGRKQNQFPKRNDFNKHENGRSSE
jgi:hypothetical protein